MSKEGYCLISPQGRPKTIGKGYHLVSPLGRPKTTFSNLNKSLTLLAIIASLNCSYDKQISAEITNPGESYIGS